MYMHVKKTFKPSGAQTGYAGHVQNLGHSSGGGRGGAGNGFYTVHDNKMEMITCGNNDIFIWSLGR